MLLSAARLQREVPGAVLVGGTAVALLEGHRYSHDADHVMVDLKDRYGDVLQHLESLEGWTTARKPSRRPVTILGSLDGQMAGVRRLRRTVPLETQVVYYSNQPILIPTHSELLRIKAYLVLERNFTRDYVDFLALASDLNPNELGDALSPLEQLYGNLRTDGNVSSNGMLFDLGTVLKRSAPNGGIHKREEWTYFDAMDPSRRPWDLERIRQEGQVQGERVLSLWRALSDIDEPPDADTLREHKTLKDRPVRPPGAL